MPEITAVREVVVVPVDALDSTKITELAETGPFTVLYLATSLSKFATLRRQLPQGWTMPVPGAALNEAAERLRDMVINLDEQAWLADADRQPWDSSLLGERGPLASTVMLNLCRLLVLVEAMSQPGRYLVVADDRASSRLLAGIASQRGMNVGWLAPGRKPTARDRLADLRAQAADALAVMRRRASVFVRFLARKLHLALARRRRPLPLEALREADVLLTVWGRADTFPRQGTLVREYNYGRLPELLRRAGFRTACLAHPLTYVAPFRDIAANALAAEEPVALIEDFIPWWAIIPAMFRGLRFPRQVRRLSIFGIDATDLLRLEAARDRRMAVCVEASLLRHVAKGLARRAIRPNLLLYLYEAQPWEKMLTRGLRESLPSTRIVGVQHAFFAGNYLSFFPSRRSLADGIFPDLLLTAGPGYSHWFHEAGVPADRVAEVGALRYEGVGAGLSSTAAVLCCTGIELDEAVELAVKSARAMDGLGVPLVINFHPVTDTAFQASFKQAVADELGSPLPHVTFSSEPMRGLLGHARTVLYTTSAACFEAVQTGRRAIYVARDLELDYDKLPDEVALHCRSVDELRRVLIGAGPAVTQPAAALNRWLAPVIDCDALRRLLAA
ncbi:MAG: hypothetical protein ABSC37_00675 [Xanthobacteraceae bacterium]